MTVLKADLLAVEIPKHHGNLAAVGRALGVTRSAVHRYVQKRPALLAMARDQRETMKDHAESALFRQVIAGEAWAVCFFLKTQARDRGYGTKVVVAGDPHQPLVHRLVDKEYEVGSNGFDPNDA